MYYNRNKHLKIELIDFKIKANITKIQFFYRVQFSCERYFDEPKETVSILVASYLLALLIWRLFLLHGTTKTKPGNSNSPPNNNSCRIFSPKRTVYINQLTKTFSCS